MQRGGKVQDGQIVKEGHIAHEATVALLARSELFARLDRALLEVLADELTERSYGRGQILFHEGDVGDAMFVLAEGLVKVTVTSPKGDQMLLVTLQAPSTFGELSLIDGRPRSASVEVVEACKVLILGRDVWGRFVTANPVVTGALLGSLARMVRRLTDQTADFAFLDLHGRTAKQLVRFVDERGEETVKGILLDLHLTQTDIARMIGGSRQSVNQILSSFQDRGYLKLSGRTIVVKELVALRRLAGLL